MPDDENDLEDGEATDNAAPDATHQGEAQTPWWAVPLAFAGAFAVKYLARRGQEAPPQKPPAPAGKPPKGERIKDADFKVKE